MVRRRRNEVGLDDIVVLSSPGDVYAAVQRRNDLFLLQAHGDGIVLDSVEARRLREYLNTQDDL